MLKPIVLESLDSNLSLEDVDDKLLCPVRCLSYYISRTRTYRSSKQGQLFISYQRGYDKDSSDSSISRYLKQAIAMDHSEIDPNSLKSVSIKPHSVRHMATSSNALKHFSVDDVIASWTWTWTMCFCHNKSRTLRQMNCLNSIVLGDLSQR